MVLDASERPAKCSCWNVARDGHELVCDVRRQEERDAGVWRQWLEDLHADEDREDPRCD